MIIGYNDSPIFPGEIFPILKFTMTVDKLYYDEFENNATVELKLYDSSSIKTTEYKLNELKPIQTTHIRVDDLASI